MTNRLSILVFAAGFGLLIAVGSASPQFETPNRSFHNATKFRLEGRHLTVACESCHLKGQFSGTPTTCYECHWIRRKDDVYQTRLGSQCEACHRSTSWTDVRFDHASTAGIPLNADHRQLACDACHKSGDVRAGTIVCVSCHRKDYDAAKNPAHAAAGFPVTCEACHQPGDSTWQTRGGFSHAAIFPLLGVHATQACAACHKNNVYKGTPRECIGCHQADYNRTQAPNHSAAGFPTTCDQCHRASDPTWTGVSFNHSAFFPLVGVHATQACGACHKNNVYRGTPRDCVGCHLADYNRSVNPNHAAAGFPTTCDTCHRATDTSWSQGRFTHTWFPLSGPHNVRCVQCHTTPNNYVAFSCTVCHDRSSTDSHHSGVSGYRYDSQACYACHPQGRH